jgi:hypothetical protein
MWILKVGRKPLEWLKVNCEYQVPQPRYAHSLSFYEKGNYLVLHGGRNDYSSDSFALGDTWLFELSRMEWIEVQHYSNLTDFQIYNRCYHSSIVYGKYLITLGDTLLIFGGMNNCNYIGSSLFIMNLDLNYHLREEIEFYLPKVLKNKRKEIMRRRSLLKMPVRDSFALPPIK